MNNIPLSLYIHVPWCIRKCPYCDFNSHRSPDELPEAEYVKTLLADLETELPDIWGRRVHSIFIGGGTPSLFSGKAFDDLLSGVAARVSLTPGAEITLEANPGTFEQQRFCDFFAAGINRLSIGIQSFQDDLLQRLGRVHDSNEAKKAVDIARKAGFENINLDLMHGLPNQTIESAVYDLKTAIEFNPEHISWYQLTLEPNTVFAKHPPILPEDDVLWDIQQAGHALLTQHNYQHYEVSAYAHSEKKSQHNLNYWQFGDYIGIGAGAHGKLTHCADETIIRKSKIRNPRDYLSEKNNWIAETHSVMPKERPLEFMMNALRLRDGVPLNYFTHRTGLDLSVVDKALHKALEKNYITLDNDWIKTTETGFRFLNDCLLLFDEE